eukprot:scaffold17595_cov61-Phaeocystis_antarctica.AAC.8
MVKVQAIRCQALGGVAGDVLERLDKTREDENTPQTLGQPNVLREPYQLVVELIAQQRKESVGSSSGACASSLSTAGSSSAATCSLFTDRSRTSSPSADPLQTPAAIKAFAESTGGYTFTVTCGTGTGTSGTSTAAVAADMLCGKEVRSVSSAGMRSGCCVRDLENASSPSARLCTTSGNMPPPRSLRIDRETRGQDHGCISRTSPPTGTGGAHFTVKPTVAVFSHAVHTPATLRVRTIAQQPQTPAPGAGDTDQQSLLYTSTGSQPSTSCPQACTSSLSRCACMAAITTVRPPACVARRRRARTPEPPLQMWRSASQPPSCTFATCGCARIAATASSSAPVAAARRLRSGAAASSPVHMLASAQQPYSCTMATCGCARNAATTSSIAPAATASRLRSRAVTSSPKHIFVSAQQPCTCTFSSCGYARIAATTSSIAPAVDARCLPADPTALSPVHTLPSAQQPYSCTCFS